MNMPRRVAGLFEGYRPVIQKWLPDAALRPAEPGHHPYGAILEWKATGGTVHRYLVEEKRHLRVHDIAVVVEQLARLRLALPHRPAEYPLLLLAPHIRAQQAAVLERAGIDYLDLAGNAHLTVPGVFVHVEGQRAPKAPAAVGGPATKGWVKTVLALLARPELADVPYREIADHAGVALGTVAKGIKDIERRGLFTEGRTGRRINDRAALVALWTRAYVEVLRPRLDERRFQIRADNKHQVWKRLKDVMAERRQPWALTGADAAALRTQFFRAPETEIYAPVHALDDRDTQRALTAQPAARTANLIVIEPPGPLAIPEHIDHAPPAAPDVLAYAELRYRGTDQAQEAADLLLPRVLEQ